MRTSPNERLTPDTCEPGDTRASASERRCILSGKSYPRESLVRLAISPEGVVLPDVHAKAPGRGAWIAPDRGALEAAMADGHFKRSLMRAFKGGPQDEAGERIALSYAADLPQAIQDALTRHVTDRLGLELRGGNIVLGSSRIEEQARMGMLGLLAHASDASEGSRRKLDQAWRVGLEIEGSGERGIVLPLDRAALSVALGRENVVHLGVSSVNDARSGVKPGKNAGAKAASLGAAERVGQAVRRLAQFVESDPGSPALAKAVVKTGDASATLAGDI